jgi:hypothetical protein
MRRKIAVLVVLVAAGWGLGVALLTRGDTSARSQLPAADFRGSASVPGLSATGAVPALRVPRRAASPAPSPTAPAANPATAAPPPPPPTPRPASRPSGSDPVVGF